MQWEQVTTLGPKAKYLTSEQFGELFGLSEDTVRRMVKAGILPAPVQVSEQKWMHTQEQAIYWRLKLEIDPPEWSAAEGVKGKAANKPAATPT